MKKNWIIKIDLINNFMSKGRSTMYNKANKKSSMIKPKRTMLDYVPGLRIEIESEDPESEQEPISIDRIGFFGDDVIESGVDNRARLQRIREKILESFPATLESVRKEVATSNRDNLFLIIVNFLGGFYL